MGSLLALGLAVAAQSQQAPAPVGNANGTLSGVVLTPAGEPAAGVEVQLRRYPLRDTGALDIETKNTPQRELAVATDARGAFAAELPEGLAFELRIAKARCATEVVRAVYAGESLRIRLQRPAFLDGVVTDLDTGKAVAGAGVYVTHVIGGARTETLVTDASGTFRFANLMPGTVRLAVVAPAARTPSWPTIALEPGRTRFQQVGVRGGGVVHGRVTDADTGQPIEGAEISPSWTFRRLARTDAEGRYELHGVDLQEFVIRAGEYGKQTYGYLPAGARVDRHTERERLDWSLVRGRIARGRIVDATGAPVAGVYVAAMASEFVGRTQQSDWLHAVTDADGAFEIDAVRRDVPHCLFVGADGYGTLVFDFPTEEAKLDVVEFGAIPLPRATYVTGRLLDQNGQPLADAAVRLNGSNADRYRFTGGAAPGGEPRGSFYVNGRSRRTDSRGRYHFADVAPGKYTIKAHVEEVTPRLVGSGVIEAEVFTCVVRAGRERIEHDFVVDLGASLCARVLTPSGRVPPSVQVTIEADRVRAERKPLLVRPGIPFRLFQLPPGPLTLALQTSGSFGGPPSDTGFSSHTSRDDVRAGRDEIWVSVAEPEWVQAFVVDREGRAVEGARVAVHDAAGNELETATSDWRGSVGLKVGKDVRVRLVARRAAGDAPSVTSRELTPGTANVVIRLP